MTASKTSVLVIGVAVIVALAALGAYLIVNNSSKMGTVSIYVKDLPDEWSHVNVTFSEVKIHEASAGNESGWHTLELQNQTIDLASLVNVSKLLASGNVSVGKYTQIRLVVVSVTGVMTNGTHVNFTVPSGELKTTHPFNVTEDQTQALVLDIDLSQSIVHNSSGWIFTPVVGSITEGSG
jgi:hypothetical protein